MKFSAPGKLFLFGEYAVLGGGWSIVTAVDRRVTAEERPGEAYTLEGAEADSALPALVLEKAEADFDPRALHCDVSEIYRDESKLGLGSSAASCAAVAGLGLGTADDRDRAFEVAGGAHREFQNGRGSHADVAVSIYGGTIAYRLLEPVPPFPRLAARAVAARTVGFAEIAPIQLPGDLRIRAYWLGEPASSTTLIGRVEPALEAGNVDALNALEAIAAASEWAIDAIERDDCKGVLEAASLSHTALERLGDSTGAPIVTADAAALIFAAEQEGVFGKMSGAGGGDFVVLFGETSADWELLEVQFPGLWLDLTGDEEGLRREEI